MIHARVRSEGGKHAAGMIADTIDFANELTGEPIGLDVPHDGAFRRPDALAADRRRDHHLQHADRAARRGRERRHRPHARSSCCASTARSSSSSPTTRASRCFRTYRIVMPRARITKSCAPTRRSASSRRQGQPGSTTCSRACATKSGWRASLPGASWRDWHEARHLRRARHDRQDLGAAARHPQADRARRTPAFLKIDVQYAEEDEQLAREFGIPTRKVYSGELCPDHCNVMVLGDAMEWARKAGCDVLLVETAGLCLRCAPYVDGGLGICVLEATSGMNLPLKVGPILSLADVAW